jgi:carbon-monoxide dehydrogenase medium subunit
MSFSLHHPVSVAAAVALARTFGDSARFIAGGTDLIVQIARKRQAPAHLIDLGDISGLAAIAEHADGFLIGALASHKTIERHGAFQGALAALAEAARVVGGHQIRNRATVGGNIANASPAADLVIPLLALDAELTLAGPDGARHMALDNFFLGPGQTARRPDELITAIRFAKLPPASATSFIKAGRRRAMEISIVCVAARLTLDTRDGVCRDARVALGAVDATAVRGRTAEQMLEGRPAVSATFAEAGRLAAAACHPISDVRASADYRRRLVATLVSRALNKCVARIAETRA